MNNIFPIIGIFTSLILYISPFYGVITFLNKLDVKREVILEINKFNPLPITLALLNSNIWTKYALVIDDILLLLANIPGLVISIISMSILLPKINKHKDIIVVQTITGVGLPVQIILFTILDIIELSLENINLIYGILSNLCFLLMCISPLYTFKTVIKKRDSSSLSLLLAIAQNCNCTLWIIYGINQNNLYITLPNSIGLFLGLIQLFLILIFNIKCGLL